MPQRASVNACDVVIEASRSRARRVAAREPSLLVSPNSDFSHHRYLASGVEFLDVIGQIDPGR